MRVFVAIKAPKFSDLTENLNIQGVKVVKDFHLTLKFLGEVDESRISEIKQVVESIKFPSFKVKTTDIGVFPNETYIQVVWLGLDDGGKTVKIQSELEDKLEKLGFKKESRPFLPHITLARVKFVENKAVLMEKVKSIRAESKDFVVDRIFLIKSELTPTGPVYTDL